MQKVKGMGRGLLILAVSCLLTLCLMQLVTATVTVAVGSGTGGIGTSTATTTISGAPTNGGNPTFTFPVITNAHSPLMSTYINFANGDNTISIPNTAGWMAIIPPTANAVSLTLKGVGADTGIGLNPAAPIGPLPLPATPPASIIINAGGAVNGVQILFY